MTTGNNDDYIDNNGDGDSGNDNDNVAASKPAAQTTTS
jgi:hypothetical protein